MMDTNRLSLRWPMSTALATVFLVGCGKRGPTTYPVEGRVVFADGSLMPGGTIEFESLGNGSSESGPAGLNARGVIGSDGTFTVITPPDRKGAVLGPHRVLVRALAPDHDEPALGEAIPARQALEQQVIDRRFERYETSGLQVTVEPNPNQFTIQVARP
jgi:hypothetical protein